MTLKLLILAVCKTTVTYELSKMTLISLSSYSLTDRALPDVWELMVWFLLWTQIFFVPSYSHVELFLRKIFARKTHFTTFPSCISYHYSVFVHPWCDVCCLRSSPAPPTKTASITLAWPLTSCAAGVTWSSCLLKIQ